MKPREIEAAQVEKGFPKKEGKRHTRFSYYLMSDDGRTRISTVISWSHQSSEVEASLVPASLVERGGIKGISLAFSPKIRSPPHELDRLGSRLGAPREATASQA